MAAETTLTVTGNLTADPELRFLASGAGVATFTVASTPRTFDRNAQEWRDGETLFMRCNAWREYGEHIAETFTKGMSVIVTGRLVQRSWERNGEKRTAVELEVDEAGPTLRYATATVRKTNAAGMRAPHKGPRAVQGTSKLGTNSEDPWASETQGAGW